MTHEVIVSRATDFTADGALEKYMAMEETPNMDVWMPDVQTIILGFNKVVLIGEDGHTRFVGLRRNVKGLAIDGEAVPVHGEYFRRFRIDGDRKASVESTTLHYKEYKVMTADATETFEYYAAAKEFYDKTPGAVLVEEDGTKYVTWTKDITDEN